MIGMMVTVFLIGLISVLIKLALRASRKETAAEKADPSLRKKNLTSTFLLGHDYVDNSAVRAATKARKAALKEIADDEHRAAVAKMKEELLKRRSR